MATSLWSSIIISFFVGLFVGSAIYSNRSANLLTTFSDCVEKCNRQNVTDMSEFAGILQQFTSTFGFLSDIRYLINSEKVIGLGQSITGYLSSVNYYDNLRSVVKYVARFGAIGTMEQDQLGLKALCDMFQYGYRYFPSYTVIALNGLYNVPWDTYYSVPDNATVLHEILVVVSKLGAIGSSEQYIQAYEELGKMANGIEFPADVWRIAVIDVQAMKDEITKKYTAFQDQTETFVDSVNWVIVNIVLITILIVEVILYFILDRRQKLKLEEKIQRVEKEQKQREVQSEQKKTKKEGKAKRRRKKNKRNENINLHPEL